MCSQGSNLDRLLLLVTVIQPQASSYKTNGQKLVLTAEDAVLQRQKAWLSLQTDKRAMRLRLRLRIFRPDHITATAKATATAQVVVNNEGQRKYQQVK